MTTTNVDADTRVHPLACVDTQARLGQGVVVGPFAVIEAHTQIGDGCVIHPHAVVRRFVTLGRECQVHPTAVIGDVAQDLKFKGGRSYVKIGDRSVFRESVTVHRGTDAESTTELGDDVYLMHAAHVGHNSKVANGVIFANCTALGGYVTVEERAFISACSNVHQFCRVGALAIITADIKITHDVPPFALVNGPPRAIAGPNVVGLQRAGKSKEAIAAIAGAYAALQSEPEPGQALLGQWAESVWPELQQLSQFFRSSKRGVMRSHQAHDSKSSQIPDNL